MLLKDKRIIYITTPKTEVIHGQSVTEYINLRRIHANLQYMSNEQEQREFGTVTNSIIIIRVDGYNDKNTINGIMAKDGIYLQKPTELVDEPLTYPAPDYIIFDIKGAYVKPQTAIRDPVTMKARLNEGRKK